ncbi:uncharacterized protein K441DRAFT_660077, partial [Cenococcum geophilum 1.58]|uniref:uncharacterized protein n=1 Tax=Cenococcum geophilum 1.58 TaxID=794803 RepID=UPI00358F0C60
YKALHEALHKALRSSTRSSTYRGSAYGGSTRSSTQKPLCVRAIHYYRVPAIFPIASTRASAKYTPYIHLG